MGTSQSSSGSPSGVPMVPPWVPDVPEPGDELNNGTGNDEQETSPAPEQALPTIPEIAPAGRWRGSRQSLGSFARSANAADMRRGVGRYVSGLGGSRTGTRRFGGTVKTADRLYGAFSGLAGEQSVETGSQLDPALLEGRTAREIIDAVIEAVRPVDGTQDAEASRISISDALSDLMERFPDADLCKLSQEQREFAIERFVSYDIYHRFMLDVGGKIKSMAPSPNSALSRLREVKDYIRETVADSFQRLRNATQRLRSGRVMQIVNQALRRTLEIFEEYII